MEKVIKELPSSEMLMDTIMNTINKVWNVGNELHKKNIDDWLENFSGNALCYSPNDDDKLDEAKEREQCIALFMLCNFVFYNKNEVKHLIKLMFEKYIHFVFDKENKITVTDDNINNLLRNTQFSSLGFPSESSSYLLYHFRQENALSRKSFKENPKANNIVFIDDFSIEGTQARDYINKFIKESKNNGKDISNINYFILLMVATKKAINLLKSEIPNLNIIACIEIDEKSQAFSPSSIVFDGYNIQIKEDAKKICEYYGDKLINENDKEDGMESLGFCGGSYMFGSYYNIPDNTLPIFWSDEKNWNYLFKRYDKKYDDNNLIFGGQYV
jgi:hypothetical protein